jgi:hypothetical protein
LVFLTVAQGAAIARVLDALERAGAQPRPRGELYEFFCQAHADGSNRAGELRQGDKGALIVCHAGCDNTAVIESVGLKMGDLFDEEPKARTDWQNPDARYAYKDESGHVVYEVRRIGQGKAKQIRPGHYVNGRWEMGLPDGVRIPYRLPELKEAIASGLDVFITEGEKDADAAARLGLASTTNVGGAKKWLAAYNMHFAGARVIVVRDRDEAGHAHARQVVENLAPHVEIIRVVEAKEGNDLSDHLAAGYPPEELLLCDLAEEARAPVDIDPAASNGHTPVLEIVNEPPQPDEDIDTFLGGDEPDYDWIIPGLLERGDRVLLTGPEGGGKSTLLRQIGVQAAAGIHPFTLDFIDPIRVMYVDLENSRKQVRRQLRPLRIVAKGMDPLNMVIRVIAEGLDLLDKGDQAFLETRIQVNAPDLLIMGPLYKLVGGDPTEEKPAKAASALLDRLRTTYGFALMMEAHSPHASGGSMRPERPYGASLWLRWPEFGLYLAEDGAVRHWRGDREEREWPTLMNRGGEWPWSAVTDVRAVTFARMVEAVRTACEPLSVREVAAAVGCSKSQVHRAIDANRPAWDALIQEVTE